MMEGASVREYLVNGIRLQVTEAGEGPLVVLCHGWPELAFSWRHQIPALAAAGYRVAAPDMRGFGNSDAPDDPQVYTVLHLVGDMVGLVHAMGAGEATKLLTRHQWRDGDVALLEAAARRLRLPVPRASGQGE